MNFQADQLSVRSEEYAKSSRIVWSGTYEPGDDIELHKSIPKLSRVLEYTFLDESKGAAILTLAGQALYMAAGNMFSQIEVKPGCKYTIAMGLPSSDEKGKYSGGNVNLHLEVISINYETGVMKTNQVVYLKQSS